MLRKGYADIVCLYGAADAGANNVLVLACGKQGARALS
jgi:hypothetical protein